MCEVCRKCKREFSSDDLAASISGSILGDECTDSLFLCPTCQVYTVVTWWDNFTGVETQTVSGPISRRDGDAMVVMIRKCSRPWDKKCRCEVHKAYFRNTLD